MRRYQRRREKYERYSESHYERYCEKNYETFFERYCERYTETARGTVFLLYVRHLTFTFTFAVAFNSLSV